MIKPVILLGAGGHCKVLVDVLRQQGTEILGLTTPRPDYPGGALAGIALLGGDDAVMAYNCDDIRLVNTLGSNGPVTHRRRLFAHFATLGYHFADVIHPATVVSELAVCWGEGLQILAGAIVNPSVSMGRNVIVNSRAVVEHDCRIGEHSHIATGAVLCGGCQIGNGVHIGAGATVNPGLSVGDGAVIASGSVVIEDVAANTLVAGVPAQYKRTL